MIIYEEFTNRIIVNLCSSPVYIDNTADLEITTKRVLWGKCINAGQTCIAPDYILCTKEVQDAFVKHAKNIFKEWYGDNPQESPDFCRIINTRNFAYVINNSITAHCL